MILHQRPALDPRVAALIFGLSTIANLVAVVAMVTVLRDGTLIGGDPVVRMNYIAAQRAWWLIGWGVWMVATLSLLAVFLVLVDTFRRLSGMLATLAIVVATMGGLSDLLGDLVLMTMLPEFARRFAEGAGLASAQYIADFELWDRLATALTGGFANTAYGLTGLLLLPGLLNARTLPRSFAVWAACVWVAALVASVLLAAGSGLVELAFGATMVLYITWAGAMVTWFLHRAREEFTESSATAGPAP